jgi:hypothetical protein
VRCRCPRNRSPAGGRSRPRPGSPGSPETEERRRRTYRAVRERETRLLCCRESESSSSLLSRSLRQLPGLRIWIYYSLPLFLIRNQSHGKNPSGARHELATMAALAGRVRLALRQRPARPPCRPAGRPHVRRASTTGGTPPECAPPHTRSPFPSRALCATPITESPPPPMRTG